jgi:hypothetical protein
MFSWGLVTRDRSANGQNSQTPVRSLLILAQYLDLQIFAFRESLLSRLLQEFVAEKVLESFSTCIYGIYFYLGSHSKSRANKTTYRINLPFQAQFDRRNQNLDV